MDADRVKVFHRADGDDIVFRVADDLKLDLLPAGDALFNQNLGNGGETQAVGCDIPQLRLVIGDTSAGTAQRKCGTDDNRVVDYLGKINSVLDRCNDLGGDNRLVDGFHRILEALPVFGLVDCFGVGAEQFNAVFIQKTAFCSSIERVRPV